MDPKAHDSIDIKAQILQTTLNEVASRGNGDQDHVECCVICLETISEACEVRPCQHRNFDFLCLLSWLEQQPSCPLCKAGIREIKYENDGEATFVVPERKDVRSTAPPRRPLPPRRNWPYYRPHRRRDLTPEADDEAQEIGRRRQVYRDQSYSLHVGSNRLSQYRELTPQLFEQDASLVSRARMWLRRELKVFEFLHTPTAAQGSENAMTRRRANNAEFLLEYIVAILKTVDIQGSQGQAEDMLQEFLGRENTRLLLHELKSFLRSPFTSLQEWDSHVQYDASKQRQLISSGDDTAASTCSSPKPRGDVVRTERNTGDSYRPQYSEEDDQGMAGPQHALG